ncbi:hypothetical protein DB88DRAFT_108011 [Papiliotrema laurentii]|uniref:DUF6534 domain-containing protein n=1 Tax=Papiliotrema laurentii TaxID=5418 RepID=A0AAD9FN14_PAPLA|nr:hypothetical protein DB88DRAFT_108011 [Papiliotrema laurentii]
MSGVLGSTPAPVNSASIMEQAAKAALSPHRSETLGPFLLGWITDIILFGVMVHQAALWAQNFKVERMFIKVIILWTLTVATATTAWAIWYLWSTFVTHFGEYYQFSQTRNLSFYGLLDVATIFPIQLFYLERAYRLNHEKLWIPLLILPMMITAAVGGIGTFVLGYGLRSVLELKRVRTWFFVWLGTTAGADILLTGLIVWGLAHSRSGWIKTDRLVNRLIRTSLESQLPCTIIAILFLVYFGVRTDSMVNGYFQVILTKVYTVSILAVLNYRYTLHKALPTTNGDSHQRLPNTLEWSNRHQQDTLPLDKIHIDTVIYEQSYQTGQPPLGINRQRPLGEVSGDSSSSPTGQETSSVTRLRPQQSTTTKG